MVGRRNIESSCVEAPQRCLLEFPECVLPVVGSCGQQEFSPINEQLFLFPFEHLNGIVMPSDNQLEFAGSSGGILLYVGESLLRIPKVM
jgi:hypothetical protein